MAAFGGERERPTDWEQRAKNAEAELASLRAELEAVRPNADKFLWLDKRYCGADFAYGESKRFVILFSWPESAQISSNLTTSIEAAQLAELFDGKVRIDGEKA